MFGILTDVFVELPASPSGPNGIVGHASPDGAPHGPPLASTPPPPLYEVTFVVVDVETTGGSPATAELTEVGAARYRNGECTGTFRSFVRPDERIPPSISDLTGITDAMVADAPPAGEILPSLLEFVGPAVVVGHNVRFDLAFLDHALVSTGRPPLGNPIVDTLVMARRLVRDDLPNCQLSTLAAELRLDHRPTHRALADALATGDLLHDLLERAGTYGIVDLGELLVLSQLLGHPQSRKLRATARLPNSRGLFWLQNARGRPLLVDVADDVRRAVRSQFLSEHDRRTNQLLRQVHAVGHRRLAEGEDATAVKQILLERWDPPFNRCGRRRAARRGTNDGGSSKKAGTTRL